ncbi:MAG: 3,4-dihydroxy-2-butanone-4-phosphate synthase, partial [Nakamurella sp.]
MTNLANEHRSPAQAGRAATAEADAGFDSIDTAIADIAAGRAVIVVDDEDRENEGDLVFAAAMATQELVAFTVRYSAGVICVPLTAADCDRLALPQMLIDNEDRKGTAFTVSVDAKHDVTTGISAAERALTIRTLADPATVAGELSRPGHVFPLQAREGGVLVRPGHTEAAVDLATLAGLPPAGGICEIVNDDGSMARLPQLREFAAEHGLTLISIADLIAYRRARERQIRKIADARLPLPQGEFRAIGYLSTVTGRELIALVYGDLADGENVLTRV